jgi:SAM-dependent methyltransferase
MENPGHQQSTNTQKAAYKKLNDLMGFRWKWSALVQAARLKLGDVVPLNRPITIDELAEKTQTHAPSLYLLFQFLAYSGIFTEVQQGLFEHNDFSHFLRSDVPFSLYYTLLMEGSSWNQDAWDSMGYSMQTGASSFSHSHGKDIWQYFASHDQEKQLFDKATMNLSELFDQELAHAYDFSTIERVVDVGGGQGTFLYTLLETYPHLHATLLELASTMPAANNVLRTFQDTDRCTLLTGDYLEAVPAGADLYILKQVLHVWDDEQATRILQCCRKAMRPDSRLLIAEMFPNPPSTNIPEKGYDPFVGFQSLQMLVLFGGRERSAEDFQKILHAAGLQCIETRRTPSPYRFFVCQAQE